MKNMSPICLQRRHSREKRFRWYGRLACGFAVVFLLAFLGGLLSWAFEGMVKYEVKTDIYLDPHVLLAPHKNNVSLALFDMDTLCALSYIKKQTPIPGIPGLLAPSAHRVVFDYIKAHPEHMGSVVSFWLPIDADQARILKNISLSPQTHNMLKRLENIDHIRKCWRFDFFTNTDSRDPVAAGIWSGLVGTFFLFIVTLGVSFPIGVAAAFYLEELAKPSTLSRLIEVNISNLAAVPSVVFGILGLAIFINVAHLPRSSTLVGGITLALMTLPTLIIVTRTAIRTVPKSIRESARGLGASQIQIIFHHLFPIALPGILTGTMLAISRALGETAPLLMIGMMAFVADAPGSIMDPSSALPVQIFSWVRNPEVTFLANASAAILVLLLFLGALNLLAITLRGKYEHKW